MRRGREGGGGGAVKDYSVWKWLCIRTSLECFSTSYVLSPSRDSNVGHILTCTFGTPPLPHWLVRPMKHMNFWALFLHNVLFSLRLLFYFCPLFCFLMSFSFICLFAFFMFCVCFSSSWIFVFNRDLFSNSISYLPANVFVNQRNLEYLYVIKVTLITLNDK